MEIKLLLPGENPEDSGNFALAQIKDRGYAEKYLDQSDSTVYEVGLVFSREERNLVGFDWEKR